MKKGILDSTQRPGSKGGGRKKDHVEVVEMQGSGDYLAFMEEGDPIYLPRDILDWLEERQASESFIQKLSRSFSRKN